MFANNKHDVARAFESPNFAIRAVRENIGEVEVIATEYLAKARPRSAMYEKKKEKLTIFSFIFDQQVPDRLRYLCATSIEMCRHALDQATCAAYQCSTGEDAPGKLYFPIGSDAANFRSKVRNDLPAELHSVFEPFMIFKASEELSQRGDIICALNKAARNKHRVYCSPIAQVGMLEMDKIIYRAGDNASAAFYFPFGKVIPESREIVLAQVGPGGNFTSHAKYHFGMGLFNAGKFSGQGPAEALDLMLRNVSAIIEEIEAGVVGLT